MNKRYYIVFIVLVLSVIIMNILWFSEVERLKLDNRNLTDSHEITQTEFDRLFTDFNYKINESNELDSELDESKEYAAKLESTIYELERKLNVYELNLERLEKLARDFSLKLPESEAYETMALCRFNGKLHNMPYNDSEIIYDNESIGFVLGEFVNSLNEEWLYVETFSTKNQDERYGFIESKFLSVEIEPVNSKVYSVVEFDGIRIGDDIYDLLDGYNHDLVLEVEDEYWTIDKTDYSVLVHPEDWIVLGLLTRQEKEVIFDGIRVGVNVQEAIETLSLRYSNIYEPATGEIMDNWFDLGNGIVLSLDYVGSNITDTSTITEITVMNLKYMD